MGLGKAYLLEAYGKICDYVAGCLHRSSSGRRDWIVYSKSILDFLDIDRSEPKSRCERILKEEPEWLTDRRRLGLESLLFALDNPDEEFLLG